MPRTCCKYFTVSLVPVAALLLAVLFAFGILALPILYTELARKYEYGIVIDAGSTHTKAYVYQLDVPITGRLEELDAHKVDDSINNHADRPEKAGYIVEELVNKTKKSLKGIKVPDSMLNSTRIYVGATGGMRLLRRTNPLASNKTLDAVKSALEKSGYKEKSANIISGREEAASGWATANYLRNYLKGHDGWIGALDLGGASTQISFPAPAGFNTSDPHYVTKTIMNKTEHLYARSYLCYGHTEALGRFLAHLIGKQGNITKNITNPCLAKGVPLNFTFGDIYTTCANESIAKEVFGFSLYPPPNFKSGQSASFVGSGSTSDCQAEIHTVFDFFDCPVDENCDDSGYQPPPVSGTVIGFSGYQYVAKKLNISDKIFNSSNPLSKTVVSQCEKVLKNNTNTTMCFHGMYMAYVIERGFGMNASSSKWSLEFLDKKDSISFGWAMGFYMDKVYKFSSRPYHEAFPYTTVDMVVGMLILTILCVIFVVFFFLTFYACKKALNTHDGYQSIS